MRGCTVTPFAGVWIEITHNHKIPPIVCVTPFAGVWIEITVVRRMQDRGASPPSRGCGLKS